jgi:IPT/TIG domain
MPGTRRRVIRTFTAADMGTLRHKPEPIPLDPGDPKHPTLTKIDPVSALIGEYTTALTVHGSGFTEESVILVDGTARATAYVSPNVLTTDLDMSQVTAAGNVPVVVRNGRVRTKEPVTLTYQDPEVPEGTTEEVLAWVNYSAYRAKKALAVEQSDPEPRDDLINDLMALISAGS